MTWPFDPLLSFGRSTDSRYQQHSQVSFFGVGEGFPKVVLDLMVFWHGHCLLVYSLHYNRGLVFFPWDLAFFFFPGVGKIYFVSGGSSFPLKVENLDRVEVSVLTLPWSVNCLVKSAPHAHVPSVGSTEASLLVKKTTWGLGQLAPASVSVLVSQIFTCISKQNFARSLAHILKYSYVYLVSTVLHLALNI